MRHRHNDDDNGEVCAKEDLFPSARVWPEADVRQYRLIDPEVAAVVDFHIVT